MGNIEVHDMAPVRPEEREMLDLSRTVNHKEYCKHVIDETGSGFTELPWHIMNTLSLYERMDASFNEITYILNELPLRLPHLYYVNLNHNRITQLPESFGLLFHLQTVLLSHNKLSKLPDAFTNLVKLKKVDLSHNMLEELPESIGEMESLEKLNVCNNKLTALPLSLGHSSTLIIILAKNNLLKVPPQALCDEGSEETLKQLRKLSPVKVVKASPFNEFIRVRGNQLHSSVSNLHSAQAQYIQAQTATTNTPSRIKTPLLPPLGSSKLDAVDLRDRIVGMLYGAAIGDAMGIATAYMTPDECHFNYEADTLCYDDIVRDQLRSHWLKGDWTMNFDQMMLVLDSIIHWAGVVDELDFAKRQKFWSDHGFKELGDKEGIAFSNTITKIVNHPRYLEDPHTIAKDLISDPDKESTDEFCDNAALCRSLVLGIPFFHDLHEVEANAVRICKSSHCEPLCLASAVMVSVLVALMLQGKYDMSREDSLASLVSEAYDHAVNYLTSDQQKQEIKQHLEYIDYQSINVREKDRTTFVLKPLAAGIVAMHRKIDFRTSLTELMMLGGDSNTNACLAGALLGCIAGYAHLPMPWVTGLRTKQTEWLNGKINLLLDMMGIP